MRKVRAGTAVFVVLLICMCVRIAASVDAKPSIHPPVPFPTPAAEPKKFEYKGVNIGMATDALRAKLGAPKDKSDTLDLYVFSDNESALFYYSPAHAVTAIMVTYTGDLKSAPSAKDIFGVDIPAGPDGGISKMERYPKEGFWISYNRTAGNDAIVNIAVQKM